MRELIRIGKIRRPHGVKGELGVGWNDEECPVPEGSKIILKLEDDQFECELEKLRPGTNKGIIRIKEIKNRNEAEKYVNYIIYVYEDQLKQLNSGQYYVYQLVGCKIIDDETDKTLGYLTGIYPTGSNDVYEVRGDEKSFLLPAIKSVIKNIDIDKKEIRVLVPKGLLDE